MTRCRKFAVAFGCAVCPLGIFAVIGAIFTVTIYDPFQFKTTILKHPLQGKGTLLLGYYFDGDISHDYYVRIKGRDSRYNEWTSVGWGVMDAKSYERESFQEFSSKDGRFVCVARKPWEGKIENWEENEPLTLVVYDSENDILWPSEHSKEVGLEFWRDAVTSVIEDNR